MPSPLASNETRIVVDEMSFYLRPTLRAAMRLERRYGGFDALLRGVAGGSVTIITDVIRESADRTSGLPDVLSTMHEEGLEAILARLILPLTNHVLALAGLDASDLKTKRDRREAATQVTFEEHHVRLYKLGTGWLGWSPETTWNATPGEITEAYAGHIEMLKAIHGVTEKAAKPESQGSIADKFRAIFAARGVKVVKEA